MMPRRPVHLLAALPFLAASLLVPISAWAAADDGPVPAEQTRAAITPAWAAGGTTPWEVVDQGSLLTSGNQPQHALDFEGPGYAQQSGAALAYNFNSSWVAHADVSQQSWQGLSSVNNCLVAATKAEREHCNRYNAELMDSALGATYSGNGYSLNLGISSARPLTPSSRLPRVVPSVPLMTTVNGVPFNSLRNSTSVQASSNIDLGGDTSIDVGASMGYVRLLPGNTLGFDTLDQKSLSFGINRGNLSGHLVGRVVKPGSNANLAMAGNDDGWSSVDLGVTWRLPKYSSSLSFGAQNLWSSGRTPQTTGGLKADQSRIPYVQYHQDF